MTGERRAEKVRSLHSRTARANPHGKFQYRNSLDFGRENSMEKCHRQKQAFYSIGNLYESFP